MSAAPELKHIHAVERWALVFSALLIGAAMGLCGPRAQLGATLGCGLMLINLWLMRLLGSRLLRLLMGPRASVMATVVLFNVKLLLLCVLIYLCIHYLPVDPIAFILGVSVLPAAIVARAIQHGLALSDPPLPGDDLKPSVPRGES